MPFIIQIKAAALFLVYSVSFSTSLSLHPTSQPNPPLKIAGVDVRTVPLDNNDPHSVWCFAVSSPITDLPPNNNFLATQVWPSARMTSKAIMNHCRPSWTVCEFGCGTGLPSLTAAAVTKNWDAGSNSRRSVIATDYDILGLALVKGAAKHQNFHNLETQQFDLTKSTNDSLSSSSSKQVLPVADLYILSDVFETAAVARGAPMLRLGRSKRVIRRGFGFLFSGIVPKKTFTWMKLGGCTIRCVDGHHLTITIVLVGYGFVK